MSSENSSKEEPPKNRTAKNHCAPLMRLSKFKFIIPLWGPHKGSIKCDDSPLERIDGRSSEVESLSLSVALFGSHDRPLSFVCTPTDRGRVNLQVVGIRCTCPPSYTCDQHYTEAESSSQDWLSRKLAHATC